MSQVKVPDVSEMTIRMDAISPEAEKELNELSWESQRAVLRLLLERPVIRSDCKRVQRLGDLRVYRMRVTRSVRLCFVCIQQVHCIVSFGSKHDFERFCNTFHGSFPNSFIPLSESTVMKKLISQTSQMPVNFSRADQSVVRPEHKESLESNPVYLEAQRIGFALTEMFETGMEGFQSKIDDDIVAQVQLMKEDLEKNLLLLAGSHKQEQMNTNAKIAELAACISEIDRMVKTQSAALRRIAGEDKVRMHQLNTEVQEHQRVIESLQQLVEKLTCRQDQLAELLANARQEEDVHHLQRQQLVKFTESLSEQVKLTSGSLNLCHHNIGRLNRLAEFRIPGIEFRSGRNEEDIKSLIVRLRLLETVVRDLAVEAIQPAKYWRRVCHWMLFLTDYGLTLSKQFRSRVATYGTTLRSKFARGDSGMKNKQNQ